MVDNSVDNFVFLEKINEYNRFMYLMIIVMRLGDIFKQISVLYKIVKIV